MIIWRRNLYSAWLAQILSLTGFGFVLPFIPFFLQEMGITDPAALNSWVGWISAAPGISMGIAAPIWGALADRYGRKLMMIRAMASGTVILFLMSLAQSPMAVLLLRMSQGFFTGTVSAAATLVASGTPQKRLSSSLGFLSSSTFIGFSLGPAIGGISAEYLGYRSTFLIGSAIMFSGFILVILFIREPENNDLSNASPEEQTAEKRAGTVNKGFFRRAASKLPWTVIAPLLIILFFLRCARSVPMPFIPIFVQNLLGRTEGAAAITGWVSGGVGLVTAISGIFLGRLGDRFSRLKLISLIALAGAVMALPIAFTHSLASFSLFYLGTAFFAGGLEPLLQSHISGLTSPGNRGALFGVQTAVGSMGWAASPLIGSILANRFSTSAVFLAMSIFFILAGIAGRSMIRNNQ